MHFWNRLWQQKKGNTPNCQPFRCRTDDYGWTRAPDRNGLDFWYHHQRGATPAQYPGPDCSLTHGRPGNDARKPSQQLVFLNQFWKKFGSVTKPVYLCIAFEKSRVWCGSSVGRAKDWKSLCRGFDSLPHHKKERVSVQYINSFFVCIKIIRFPL